MHERKLSGIVAFWAVILGAALYLAAKAAMVYYPGVPYETFESAFYSTIQQPFAFKAAEQTAAFCIIVVVIWMVLLASYMVTYGKYMKGKEHGQAEWGSIGQLRRRYAQKESLVISKKLRLGLNARSFKHKKNLNILLIGGSGSGKTRGYVLPNLMQAVMDYVITDPKGEALRMAGGMLEKLGYRIRVLNLIDMEKSSRFNPLAYVKSDLDILRLVTDFINATTDKDAHKGDQFWVNSETTLMQAFLLYLWHEAPSWEQNMAMIPTLLRYMVVREDDEKFVSPLDRLFAELEERDPESIALQNWKLVRNSPAKTLKSIKMQMVARINKFLVREVADLLGDDEMELNSLGSGKQPMAIFCVIPDNDKTFNFIPALLYARLFKDLYYRADHSDTGRLPRQVAFVLDEFANIALPDDFDQELGTCRSRGISVSIILQNLTQLKPIFKDRWDNIVGNCNTLLYLGGSNQETREYFSKDMGKATINYQTVGKTGNNSNTSINITGRELMTSDEARLMADDDCLVLISGEKPVMDKKYQMKRHRNYKLIQPGGAAAYRYEPQRVDSYEDWEAVTKA